jgi:threonyl-tRNA synthetase
MAKESKGAPVVAAADKGGSAQKGIVLTFPDGSKQEYPRGTTGAAVAAMIGQRLAAAACAVKVDDKLYDTFVPLPHGGKFAVITFDSPEGKEIFRHTTAHILAYAIQELYPDAKNTIGPSVEEGFYYDFDDLPVTPDDFPAIEAKMVEIIKRDEKVERVELTLAEAKKLFARNPYKLEMADEFATAGDKLSAYRIGKFVDLCRGPHLPRVSMIKAVKLTKLAGAYWRGDIKNKQLTRVYGLSFPEEKQMKQHLAFLEEAAKRDHRKIGKELRLFMFHDWSPGSPFLLPKGTIIYNELLKFIRQEYVKRGYEEVVTPQMFNKSLWEASGHWEHYRENMFLMTVDGEEFSLKPMNCPSHVLIYKNETRSYRDLPWRCADFCMLHRNELKGVLGGMTRVRKFSQDDAHIFCMPEQIQSEIFGVLDFVKYVYVDVFKFEYVAKLSTKPSNAMGDDALWERAEKALAEALNKAGIKYEVKPGEGAFYGPKIDFDFKDALGRFWQLATIQLDFNMPMRMGASYEGQDGQKHTPVMIHRAVLGSLERFLGVMVEHYAGKFPLWLSPEQCRVVTISEKSDIWAADVHLKLLEAGIRCTIDTRPDTINKKIRDAEMDKVNYILVVGEKESAARTANVRSRDDKTQKTMAVDALLAKLKDEISRKA